jgi:hypothetical protein
MKTSQKSTDGKYNCKSRKCVEVGIKSSPDDVVGSLTLRNVRTSQF